jgi:hypothetical protein
MSASTDPTLSIGAPPPAALPSVGTLDGGASPDPAELRWAYAIAAFLMLASLFAAINPSFGAYVTAWPWSVKPGRWTVDTATTFALGAATLLLWACVFLVPGLVRGAVAAVGCILCVVAMHPQTSTFSVVGYVPPLAAATLAGALYGGLGPAASGSGRRAAAIGAVVLAAMLLYPIGSEATRAGSEEAARAAGSPYVSWATRTVEGVRTLAGAGDSDHLRRYLLGTTTVLTLGYALLALLGLVAALTSSRAVRWVGAATFAVTLLWAFGFPLVDGWIEPELHVGRGPEWEDLPAAQFALRRSASALLMYYVAPAAAAFAATADFVRRSAAAVDRPADREER